MDQNDISLQLKEFLEHRFPNDGTALESNTDLLEDWFIDSLGIVETVLFIEETFGLVLTRADINGTHFRDLSSLSAFVAGRLNG